MKSLKQLYQNVIELNQKIVSEGLVKLTWGNASGIDRINNRVIIKPSGIDVHELKVFDLSKVSIKTGKLIKGKTPSVDTPTHLEIYKNFNDVNFIIHTHSQYCTAFAQSKRPIFCFGTTHADYFNGKIPVVYDLQKNEIENNYEKNIGLSIVNYFIDKNISYTEVPGCLIPGHGVYVWGKTKQQALENAIVIEEVAKLAYLSENIIGTKLLSDNLLKKHFYTKHGSQKYYGQR